jgi:S1-C subfamily serine protease
MNLTSTHLITWASVCCGLLLAGAVNAQTVADAIDDAALDAALRGKGAQLLQEGKTVAAEKLREQLSRTHCEIGRLPGRAARPLSPTRCYEEYRDSVVVIGGLYQCGKCDKWHAATSAAFPIAAPDVFVTNYHVFQETNRVTHVAMTRQMKVQPVVEILAANKYEDIAIIRIPGLGLKPLALRDNAPIGAAVRLISHPQTRFYAFSQGFIHRYGLRSHNGSSKPIMEITADFALGSSGAPILDDCGNAIGMVAATRAVFHDMEKYQTVQMVFKECIPAASIRALFAPAKK